MKEIELFRVRHFAGRSILIILRWKKTHDIYDEYYDNRILLDLNFDKNGSVANSKGWLIWIKEDL